jgi:uncharacterized protein YndB with AHSA1/START domain
MRILMIFAAVAASLLPAQAVAEDEIATVREPAPHNCSRSEPSGERTLCHELVVSAPVGEVWRLLTTSEGLRTWVAPIVGLDARVGGMWETSYDASARIGDAGNIRNRILALEPQRLMVIQVANAPPNFPHGDVVKQLATRLEVEAVDATHTRVRVVMLGYGAGESFDVLYSHFDRGNAWTLGQLQARIANGPTNWSAAQ